MLWLIDRFLKAGVMIEGRRERHGRRSSAGFGSFTVAWPTCTCITSWTNGSSVMCSHGCEAKRTSFAMRMISSVRLSWNRTRGVFKTCCPSDWPGSRWSWPRRRRNCCGLAASPVAIASGMAKGHRARSTSSASRITAARAARDKFKLKRKTAKKKYQAKVRDLKDWFHQHLTTPLSEVWPTLNAKLHGHYQYYGINDNWPRLMKFRGRRSSWRSAG